MLHATIEYILGNVENMEAMQTITCLSTIIHFSTGCDVN